MNVVKLSEPLNLGDGYMIVNVELYYALYLSVCLKVFIKNFFKKYPWIAGMFPGTFYRTLIWRTTPLNSLRSGVCDNSYWHTENVHYRNLFNFNS